MTDFLAKIIREGRRTWLLHKKRMNLRWYELQVKTQQMGKNPDAGIEVMNMQVREKSLNLLDFERNREKDLFMLDVNSDRSKYGGVSETELSIMQDRVDGDTYCK